MLVSTKTNKEKSTRKKGSEGEDMAEEYLIQKGFKIVKRNFVFGKVGEIDIVAMDGSYLVFIEVKTKTSENFGDPLEWITPQKQRKLRSLAKAYLYVNGIDNQDCRFDVVTIDLTGGKKEITHLVNAM